MRYSTELFGVTSPSGTNWVEFGSDGVLRRITIMSTTVNVGGITPTPESFVAHLAASLSRDLPVRYLPNMDSPTPVFSVVDKPDVIAVLQQPIATASTLNANGDPYYLPAVDSRAITFDIVEPILVKRGEKLFLHLIQGEEGFRTTAIMLVHVDDG